MLQQAKECQRLPTASRNWESLGQIILRINQSYRQRNLNFCPPAVREVKFLLLKPPSLWQPQETKVPAFPENSILSKRPRRILRGPLHKARH